MVYLGCMVVATIVVELATVAETPTLWEFCSRLHYFIPSLRHRPSFFHHTVLTQPDDPTHLPHRLDDIRLLPNTLPILLRRQNLDTVPVPNNNSALVREALDAAWLTL